MTSVTTSSELDFVESLKPSYSDIWIGLEKNILTSVYEWNDGAPLNFEAYSWSWSNSNNSCVFMRFKEWYKDDCLGARRAYVCSRPGCNYLNDLFRFCEVPNYTFDMFVCPSVCPSVTFT